MESEKELNVQGPESLNATCANEHQTFVHFRRISCWPDTAVIVSSSGRCFCHYRFKRTNSVIRTWYVQCPALLAIQLSATWLHLSGLLTANSGLLLYSLKSFPPAHSVKFAYHIKYEKPLHHSFIDTCPVVFMLGTLWGALNHITISQKGSLPTTVEKWDAKRGGMCFF